MESGINLFAGEEKLMCAKIEDFNKAVYQKMVQIYESNLKNNLDVTEINTYKIVVEKQAIKQQQIDDIEAFKNYCSEYLEYYWIEFSIKDKEYKISMYYKDFDFSTGNIHVLPGAIQIWKKVCCSKDSIHSSALRCKNNEIRPFIEKGWEPILRKPLFWKTENSIDIWGIINEGSIDYPNIYSNQFYERVRECLYQNIRFTYPGRGHGHYRNYSLYKWSQGENIVEVPYRFLEDERNGWFIIFGKNMLTKYQTKGEQINEFVNGGWIIKYKQAVQI